MWYQIIDQQILLHVFVKPNAKRTALLAITDEQGMVIALHARPHEGEANAELINFLAQFFDLPKTQISLERGNHSRYKKIKAPLSNIVKQLIADPLKFIPQK